MASLYLNGLTTEQRDDLRRRLLAAQGRKCFICEREIDLDLHADAVDIDHVEPLKLGGKDDETNFALTHASCNRSKQASDLRVARVLARFDRIREASTNGRGANLSDVLTDYAGAKYELSFKRRDGSVQYSFAEDGDVTVRQAALHRDDLSGLEYFFAVLPIAYLHHDDRINPRDIGGSLGRLVEEFHRGRPQLHVALGWVDSGSGRSKVKIFDGQHKATAQVLLGVTALPVRVFVDPDPDVLLTTNTNAGTTLRQVAFDQSVQRRLGHALFQDRLDRYRKEHGLPPDDLSFSERDLVQYFKGESREMKRYILDAVRDSVVHSPDNRLRDYVEFGGKTQDKPLSYSTIARTFLSFFIYPDVLDTRLDYRLDDGTNPRDLEVGQIVHLMNIVADEIYVGQYDLVAGSAKLESRVSKGDDVAEGHLRAHRMAREEVMYVWLRFVKQIVQIYFNMAGQPIDEKRLFQYLFPEPLWDKIDAYADNLKRLPVWVNRELSSTVFGGKQSYDFWQTIFETGSTPQGQQVLAGPINLMEMIKEPVTTSASAAGH